MKRVRWFGLTAQQRLGMTEQFWMSLRAEQQHALIETRCLKRDGKARVPGGIYCDHHTALLQARYRPGED
jgi:hypothetical protein